MTTRPEPASPLEPYMPRDPLMAGFWVGSLQFCLTRKDILEAFRAETGNTWTPGKTPLDQMIDKACGVDAEFFAAFAKWHNENIWGEEDGEVYDVE